MHLSILDFNVVIDGLGFEFWYGAINLKGYFDLFSSVLLYLFLSF
jgi:hypothetical protein